MNTAQLKTRRRELTDSIRELGNSKDDWSDDKQDRWITLNSEYDQLVDRQNRTERLDAVEEREHEERGSRRIGVEQAKQPSGPTGMVIGCHKGIEQRAYRYGENLSQATSEQDEEQPQFRTGEMLKALFTNQYSDLDYHEERALSGGSDTQGGVLLPKPVGSQIVDLARSASVVLRAGGQTLAMEDSQLSIARVTSDPTSYWRPETAAVTAATPAFDAVILRPKTLACIVPVSIELLQDASNVGSAIQTVLTNSLALKLDQAALTGAGNSSEPTGIRNNGDVNTTASVGTPADWTDLSTAVTDILADNYPGEISDLAWVLHPRDLNTYDDLQDTTNQPLAMTPLTSQLRRFTTTSLSITEAGGAESSFIVGDFSQCLIGMRSQIEIRVAPDGSVTDSSSNTYNATSQLMRHFVAFMRCDVALLRPTWFSVSTGVTA